MDKNQKTNTISTDKSEEYKILQETNKDKIHISFSEFSLYQQCGHKHLLEKYLKLVESPTSIHLIFGNSIHAAIEMGFKEGYNTEKRIKYFREKFITECKNDLVNPQEFADIEPFADQGENILKLLSVESILKKYNLISVEMSLYEKLFYSFHFKGFIDLVLKHKNEEKYLIIDWKTSGEVWDVNKKKKDKIFMAQMRLYKYFYARKFDVPLENIECKYIVLNRLKQKKCPELGFGEIQAVEIFSTEEEIKESLLLVADTIKKIHINNEFLKAKLNNRKNDCFFCPYKNNLTLCNDNPIQYKHLLSERKI